MKGSSQPEPYPQRHDTLDGFPLKEDMLRTRAGQCLAPDPETYSLFTQHPTKTGFNAVKLFSASHSEMTVIIRLPDILD